MSVSESERDRTVKALTRHCGDGRITLDELEQRIEAAFAASSSAELRALLRDLPSDVALLDAGPVAPSPALQARPSPPAAPTMRDHVSHGSAVALKVHTVVFVAVMALLIAIWVLAGFGYPWPIWVALPWGTALGIHAGVHKALAGGS